MRNGRLRRDVIDETARIFQSVESIIEIQGRRANGRRHSISFHEVKIMIIVIMFKKAL